MARSKNNISRSYWFDELKKIYKAKKFEGNLINENEFIVFYEFINKIYQSSLANFTFGLSPAALGSSFYSWWVQLLQAPGTQLELMFFPFIHINDSAYNIICKKNVIPGNDIRFSKDVWQSMPWRLFAENFLLLEDFWYHATTKVPGLSKHSKRSTSFIVRQILDALAPSNFIFTNPELFFETIRTNGLNILQGSNLAWQDFFERIAGLPPAGSENFIPGKQVAITPGKVVYKNHLIELIQYEAKTKTVYKEPILIIPAWIMKYYILDLSPQNSLVKWLVGKGHTVFMISWRNPSQKDRDLGMDDYFRLGAMDAIDKINSLIPKTKIHLMGYCLGGTLAMIVAALMAELNDHRLKTLSLLAAQGDFSDAGELMLFITESEVSFLKNMMWDKGYLDTKQMAGAFQMLRSYDLIWSKMVQDYMHGKRRGLIDLLAWNADATRMPYKMHSEYLEKLFLNNDFAAGHFCVEGNQIAPENIRLPIFAVSTEKDHVAPWKSVYKINLITNSDITFVLTSGGHNAGIASEPDHPDRFYYIDTRKNTTPYAGPVKWLKNAKRFDGSWWIAWERWLIKHSSKKKVSARKLKKTLPSAPGKYVLQK